MWCMPSGYAMLSHWAKACSHVKQESDDWLKSLSRSWKELRCEQFALQVCEPEFRPQKPLKKLDLVPYAVNHSTREAETGSCPTSLA